MKLIALPALLLFAISAVAEPTQQSPRQRVDEAGDRLWRGLSQEQREEARFSFEDSDERRDIRFAPFFQEGVRLGSMSSEGQQQLHGLLEASLGFEAAARTRTIRELEPAVQRAEKGTFLGFVAGRRRLVDRYFLAVFGEPGNGPWGYRFEGHHLSVNVTVPTEGDLASLTPLFLGAQPRRVPDDWEGGGIQVLQEEEETALALIASLDPAQRTTAELAYQEDRGLMLSQVRELAPAEPAGITQAALDGQQREILERLIDLYLSNFPKEARQDGWRKIDAAGRGYLRFAFALSDATDHALYFRIQGPTLMVEFDNTEGGDHIHTVVRSIGGDFGADLLAEHYRKAHGQGVALEADASPAFLANQPRRAADPSLSYGSFAAWRGELEEDPIPAGRVRR